jgi:hypothetical protein
MKKTDLYLKPGTYIKSSTTSGEVQGISLENFVVSVLNNPTCCPKPPGSPDGMLMTALPLNLTLQTVTDFVGNNSAIQLSTLRLGIRSDSSVTTQTSSVIQATTTNANLVIAPNGTGALVADIPDGTTTGGNARGTNAVDLQTIRLANTQVSSGYASVISGGESNRSSGYTSTVGGGSSNTSTGNYGTVGGGLGNSATGADGQTIVGGQSNTITGGSANGFIGGGTNNSVSSSWSTVSGGQSNTASTGTHATVIGGQSNTASNSHTIAGGLSNTASGSNSIALGYKALANATGAICIISNEGSGNPAASGNWSNVFGGVSSSATNTYASTFGGYGNTASGYGSYALGFRTEAYLRGQMTLSSGLIGNNGDSQQSLLTPYKVATLNSAATTVLSLDGTGTTNLIIPMGNNRLWAVKVVATAFVSVAGGTLVLGDSYMGEFTLLFKRVGGTSSVVGVSAGNIIYDTNMATAAFTFAAGASQDLQITFKAPTTASATTFRCVAKVELVEVAY